MKFNPIVKELIENKITVLGLWWAFTWRLYALVFGAYLGVALVVAILTIAFE